MTSSEDAADRLWEWIAKHQHRHEASFIDDLKSVLEHAFPDQQPEPEPQWFDLTPLDGHVLRTDVDFVLCYVRLKWEPVSGISGQTIRESKEDGYTQFRCLLKDAPKPEPKPATQTIVFYEVIRRIAVCNEKKEEVITWTSYPMDSDFRTGETREVVR